LYEVRKIFKVGLSILPLIQRKEVVPFIYYGRQRGTEEVHRPATAAPPVGPIREPGADRILSRDLIPADRAGYGNPEAGNRQQIAEIPGRRGCIPSRRIKLIACPNPLTAIPQGMQRFVIEEERFRGLGIEDAP
jgi:hypothetical protein